MLMDIDPAWALTVFFVALRLGVLLVLTPILSSLSGLVAVRAFFTLSLAVALVSGLTLPHATTPLTLGPVIAASVCEIAIGATLAFGVFAAFGAFSVAGKVLDIQSGFGIGSVFDPVTRAGSPLFSTMLNMLGVVVFFGMDGHHALLRGIAFSAAEIPPGSGMFKLPIDAVIRQFGLMFSLGVALIAPVMFCL